MLPLLLAVSVAFAAQDIPAAPTEAPRFVSKHAELVDLSERLWEAGVRCAGWEPVTDGPVRLTLTSAVKVGHGEALLALSGDLPRSERFPVLTEIRLVPDTTVGVLAHELAHAWAGFGTVALVEGKAELLGRCMLEGIGRGRPDRLRRMGAVPDLRAGEWWVDPYAYLAASRLVRVLDHVMPPEVLWQQQGPLDWETVDRSLAEAGTAGTLVLQALHGGRKSMRKALKDARGTGRVALEHQLFGTDDRVAKRRTAPTDRRSASTGRWSAGQSLVP